MARAENCQRTPRKAHSNPLVTRAKISNEENPRNRFGTYSVANVSNSEVIRGADLAVGNRSKVREVKRKQVRGMSLSAAIGSRVLQQNHGTCAATNTNLSVRTRMAT